MARFHIVHMLLEDRPGFEGYQEVIKTILWGLRQMGHEATYGVNEICPTATNIILGANAASEQQLISAPKDTICYNLEQLREHPQFEAGHTLTLWDWIAQNLQVWDYSSDNLVAWNRLKLKYPVKHMPICYAPLLSSIPKAEKQDIDILLYGSIRERRLAMFSSLGMTDRTVVFAYRLYGAGRDNLISRSKIVLNINEGRSARIFEIVRTSYLMANSKVVVSNIWPDSHIEEDISTGIVFAPLEYMVPVCLDLLADEERRAEIERRAFHCISQRDICRFLGVALRSDLG